jgi:nitroimidazol reductase NimA-like FMN-containing flavoprotein (pyridoxamine 5'-phosphate oxidase superfamily)
MSASSSAALQKRNGRAAAPQVVAFLQHPSPVSCSDCETPAVRLRYLPSTFDWGFDGQRWEISAVIGLLTPDEIESTLHRARVGRIGCSTNDRPYVVPISYAYHDGSVYAYSSIGRKIHVMREQPLICFEVEEIDGPSTWRCVIAEGEYEELNDASARREALSRLGLLNENLTPRTLDASGGTVVFRLRLLEKSGRFERRDA